jgi:hypothetical protein
MRRRSRCRGYTCIELAIIVGVLGSLIIVLTGVVVREAERLTYRRRSTALGVTTGEVCR